MLNKITNILRSLADFVTSRPKLKFHISFNSVVAQASEVKQHLHGFHVINTERLGKYTWKVVMRTNKSSSEVIADLAQRAAVRDVEQIT